VRRLPIGRHGAWRQLPPSSPPQARAAPARAAVARWRQDRPAL